MKRLRETREQRWQQAVVAVSALSREEKSEFADELSNLYREECALVTTQVPDDVWTQVLDNVRKHQERLFRLACVSRDWARRVRIYIQAHFADEVDQDPRILFHFPALKSLKLNRDSEIRDGALARCTQLTELTLATHSIGNKGLQPLGRLCVLRIEGQQDLSNLAVRDKLHLTELALVDTNRRLTDGLFDKLRFLTKLDLTDNRYITDAPLKRLWNMQHLCLANTEKVTDAGISHMRTLISLDLRSNANITVAPLLQMKALTQLNLASNTQINLGLEKLTQLQTLWLDNNGMVDSQVLKEMTSLRSLCLSNTPSVDGWALARLTQLEHLVLPMTRAFSEAELAPLVNLRHLVITSFNNDYLPAETTWAHWTRLAHIQLATNLPRALTPIPEQYTDNPVIRVTDTTRCDALDQWRVYTQ